MCGIPASGKSAIAKIIACDENAVILSSDEIREELYPGQEYNSNQNGAAFKELNSRLDKELEGEQNIIVDATNLLRNRRIYYFYKAKSKDYRAICVFCQKSLENAISANAKRNRGNRSVPDRYIEECYTKLEVPDISEGWDEICIIDGDEYHIEIEKA